MKPSERQGFTCVLLLCYVIHTLTTQAPKFPPVNLRRQDTCSIQRLTVRIEAEPVTSSAVMPPVDECDRKMWGGGGGCKGRKEFGLAEEKSVFSFVIDRQRHTQAVIQFCVSSPSRQAIKRTCTLYRSQRGH
jgi:hypothetical protein